MSDKYVISAYFGHDANVAIVGNGKILHYEMERFDRKKHSIDGAQIRTRLEEILRDAGISMSQVMAVGGIGCCDNYSSTHNRQAWNTLTDVDHSTTSFFGPSLNVYWISHHAAHAAYTFYTSPFEQANIIAMDGGGDAIVGKDGKFYSIVTGVGKASHAFGATDGDMTLTNDYTGCHIGAAWAGRALTWFKEWHAAGTVMAAAGISEANRGILTPDIPWGDICVFKDLQKETNDNFNKLREMAKEYPDVCLGGGVALNGVAADSLLQRSDTNNVFTAPAANDGGLAIGGALFALHRMVKEPRVKYTVETTSFAGLDCGTPEASVDIDQIVTKLANNEIVAVCLGRAESGPRALGHRSILSNPSAPGIKDKINQLKGRQPFRPVAPVLCIDKLPEGKVEESTLYKSPNSMNFMTVIPKAPKSMLETLPDACHLDGTIRAQVVDSNHILGKIIMELGRRTGVYCVLNTSLNGKGEPIVNTRQEAINATGKMGITLI